MNWPGRVSEPIPIWRGECTGVGAMNPGTHTHWGWCKGRSSALSPETYDVHELDPSYMGGCKGVGALNPGTYIYIYIYIYIYMNIRIYMNI